MLHSSKKLYVPDAFFLNVIIQMKVFRHLFQYIYRYVVETMNVRQVWRNSPNLVSCSIFSNNEGTNLKIYCLMLQRNIDLLSLLDYELVYLMLWCIWIVRCKSVDLHWCVSEKNVYAAAFAFDINAQKKVSKQNLYFFIFIQLYKINWAKYM